jgi:hypothetical protein
MKKGLVFNIGFLFTLVAGAQQLSGEKKMIEQLCGCFEVDFKYAETFSPDPDYKFHPREETGGVAELALPIEISDNKIVIQHLLIVSPTTVVKHWREEWTYENPVIWKYRGDRVWEKTVLPAEQVKGKWTQTVWEVADEPRYQGISQFVILDNRVLWQSTADAPLPRREYTVRSDYNILRRTNRIQITDSGYVHEQDNQKILRTGDHDEILVEEKGFNTYKRIDEKECASAFAYWEKSKDYWSLVRKTWQEYIDGKEMISLENKIDGKFLHEYLLALSREYTAGKHGAAEASELIRKEIERFLMDTRSANSN